MNFWKNWFLPIISLMILIAAVILFVMSFRGVFLI